MTAAVLPSHRPLVLGKRTSDHGEEWCVASEDCAFGPIGFQRVRDVLPGEMIVITEEGMWMCCCVCDTDLRLQMRLHSILQV